MNVGLLMQYRHNVEIGQSVANDPVSDIGIAGHRPSLGASIALSFP